MKIAIIALILASQHLVLAGTIVEEPGPHNDAWMIIGRVIGNDNDGALIICEETQLFGAKKPNPGQIVFVLGCSAVDGEEVNLPSARKIGVYKYGSARGASMTVRAFSIRH